MADEVLVWKIAEGDSLTKVEPFALDREERLEKWITQDASVLEPNKTGLLVIGRQVQTDYRKEIDLLCMNPQGDLVIVELKRDRTPREVTAQALDYASWVKDLGSDRIEQIASTYFKDGKSLKEEFEDLFGTDFPEKLNEEHSIKIVASEIDDGTERIIRYLSEKGIDINVVRFQMFKTAEGTEFLIRTFTVPPDEAEQNTLMGGSKKRVPFKTLEMRLEEATNTAEKEFLVSRLQDPLQEKNLRNESLRYYFSGVLRFSLRPRKKYAHVVQRGRFVDDEQIWTKHLSQPHLGARDGGKHLSFRLESKADFGYFQHAMENDAKSFTWITTDLSLLNDFQPGLSDDEYDEPSEMD